MSSSTIQDDVRRGFTPAIPKKDTMYRLPLTLAATVVAVSVVSAAPKFISVWKSPEAGSTSFAGKKVAALIISNDQSLRMAGEEALARELAGKGLQSVATYKIAPKEELQVPDRAKVWFEKSNVEGVVALRPVAQEKRTTYTPGMWTTPYYSSLWGYYGYGWGNTYDFGTIDRDTVYVVETTIYGVQANKLLWAGVSETKNPKSLQQFVEDLVKATVKELQKQGFARGIAK